MLDDMFNVIKDQVVGKIYDDELCHGVIGTLIGANDGNVSLVFDSPISCQTYFLKFSTPLFNGSVPLDLKFHARDIPVLFPVGMVTCSAKKGKVRFFGTPKISGELIFCVSLESVSTISPSIN